MDSAVLSLSLGSSPHGRTGSATESSAGPRSHHPCGALPLSVIAQPRSLLEVAPTYPLLAAGAGTDRHAAAPGTSLDARNVTRRHRTRGRAGSQRAELATTAPHPGGTLRWFVCPVTGARCRILYLVKGRWISRRAFRRAYPSQRISARERRAREAVRWAGAPPGAPRGPAITFLLGQDPKTPLVLLARDDRSSPSPPRGGPGRRETRA